MKKIVISVPLAGFCFLILSLKIRCASLFSSILRRKTNFTPLFKLNTCKNCRQAAYRAARRSLHRKCIHTFDNALI